ncbi:hypothetical protein PV327_000220 [Microctonus hyperodae]|uniref:RRM domain-containing protein n=1 Tax=Microctonus hyperodae TaxID=165561 RepID=A0AA39L1X3_MICHY|nr:hypothetical protein PV327_000220 [Microctonus hyperodae]
MATSKTTNTYNRQNWEDADFPILCPTCLGDNPYIRMTKEKYGKEYRYYGVNDPVADKLMRRAAAMPVLEPPEDKSITTLYIGGLGDVLTEKQLRDHFYQYGEIRSVTMVPRQQFAPQFIFPSQITAAAPTPIFPPGTAPIHYPSQDPSRMGASQGIGKPWPED